jgi:choice-of-anchor A domain-containing protein
MAAPLTLVAAVVLAVASLAPTAADAAFGVLGVSNSYNEFSIGDSNRSGTDTQGRAAVGGNASYGNFTVGAQSPTGGQLNLVVGGNFAASGASVRGSILVGGDASYSQPTVMGNITANGSLTLGSWGQIAGDATYGTTLANSPSPTTILGTTARGTSSLPFSFAAEAAFLGALSTAQYSASDPSVGLTYGALNVATPNVVGAYFYNVGGAILGNAVGGINITAPAGSTVVLNVGGTSAAMPNTGYSFGGGLAVDHVLFNFYQATSLVVSSERGSVLAPFATVSTGSGSFNGNLIAGSVNGSVQTQIHDGGGPSGANTLFSGDLRPIPEPSSVVLVVSGMAGILVYAWRRG